MSYDLEVSVKVEGCDKYATVGYPEYDNPTYNLGKMFRACMDWDFQQSEYYPAKLAVEKIEHGINELAFNRKEYEQYNPPNGWGSLESALRDLQSARDCIYECAERYHIECLYFRW